MLRRAEKIRYVISDSLDLRTEVTPEYAALHDQRKKLPLAKSLNFQVQVKV